MSAACIALADGVSNPALPRMFPPRNTTSPLLVVTLTTKHPIYPFLLSQRKSNSQFPLHKQNPRCTNPFPIINHEWEIRFPRHFLPKFISLQKLLFAHIPTVSQDTETVEKAFGVVSALEGPDGVRRGQG